MTTEAPFGSFESPITADLIVKSTIRLSGAFFTADNQPCWLELRPQEKGRQVVVILTDGVAKEAVPAQYNVRTRVHEYGGGSFVLSGKTIFFSNFADQRLYSHEIFAEGNATPITPEGFFWANGVADAARECLYIVREDHRDESKQPINTLVRLPFSGGEGTVIAEGFDFYSSPALSPDGKQLAYVCWNHPNMPWDNTELHLVQLGDDGSVTNRKVIAGSTKPQSVAQPRWSPRGVLHYISDADGYWNIHRVEPDGSCINLHQMKNEFDGPGWTFGHSSYIFVTDTNILTFYREGAGDVLARLDTQTDTLTPVEGHDYTVFSSISSQSSSGAIVAVASSPMKPSAVVRFEFDGNRVTSQEVLIKSSTLEIDPAYISVPRQITFPTARDRSAYALLYLPANGKYHGVVGTLPPVILLSHGGPTSQASPEFNLKIQFWTSRGFAIADVDYGGSSGYGREYRSRLQGMWGIVDVEDMCACAQYLTSQGIVDPKKTAIEGGSAGGYTTLACLAFRSEVFQAGCSHYGVGDLEALAKETHKFEARYLDGLIGQYPEEKDKYFVRSPCNFVENFCAPMALMHGLEDKVVPPGQSIAIHAAIKAKGLPVMLLLLEGEQHGFRQSHNIIKVYGAQLYFYSKVFGFTPAGEIEAVPIDNLA